MNSSIPPNQGESKMWRTTTLGEDIVLVSGVHIDAVNYHDGPEGTPYLTGPSDFENGIIRATRYTHAPIAICKAGDILLTVKGSGTGTLARADAQYCISRQLMAIRTRTWCQDFIFYVLAANSRSYKTSAAGLIPGITREHVLETVFRVPSHAEQEAIAAVLSVWDQAIGQTTALIAAKERLKQGLVEKLFDATIRFREFQDIWDSRHLGDVFVERREPGIENLPMLSVTLDSGVIPRDDIDKPVRSSLEYADHRLVRAGDIAYNMMRMWQGGCGIVAEDGLISPAYVACKPTKDIDSRFAHHLFHSRRMIYLFWAYSYGLTDDRRRLYFQEFARIPVTLSSVEEQKKIAAIIDAVDLEIAQLKQNSEALKKQKRGLMQQLLTGKVRVPEKLMKKAARS